MIRPYGRLRVNRFLALYLAPPRWSGCGCRPRGCAGCLVWLLVFWGLLALMSTCR